MFALLRLTALVLAGFALAMLLLLLALPVVLGLIVWAAVRRARPRPVPAARDAVIDGEWVVLDPARRDRG
jgi:hypothetical protein